MTTMRWFRFRTGCPSRGAPDLRFSAKAKLARFLVVTLALAALTQTGCAALGLSSPCNNGCGPSPCGWWYRLWHRGTAGADCCAPGGVGPVEIGAPPPGAVAVPAPGVVAPAPPGAVEELSPIPSATPESGSTRSGSPGAATGRTNYESARVYRGPSRGTNLARAPLNSQPSRRQTARPNASQRPSPLDNLPPLTLPAEPARSSTTPAVAPDLGSVQQPSLEIQPTSATTDNAPASNTAAQANPPPAVEAASLGTIETVPPPAEISVAPGIKHFQGLEPKLAGGSMPSVVGLDWLADKGYKTILDLREPGADQPAFIAAVTQRGMRYLPLPISAQTFDAEHVARFHSEIDQADARPLYFFDTEGDRAGALWYVRRMTVDSVKTDPKVAEQEAKDLGLNDQTIWLAANGYLDRLKPVPAAEAAATPAAVPAPASAIAPPTSPAPEAAKPAAASPAAATESSHDPHAWKPLVALVLTVLGVPIAYFSGSALHLGPRLARGRASLPAPGRSPQALPGASDAQS